MKIKIDRTYTAGYQVPQVKADIAQFKEKYTEADVLYIARTQLDFWKGNDIIKFEIEAFPGGSYYNNETHFSFHIVLDGYYAMWKIDGYMNLEGNIPSPELCPIKEFKLVEDK